MALLKQFKHKTLFCRFLAPGVMLVEKDDKTDLPGKGEDYFEYIEMLGAHGWEVVDVTNMYERDVDKKQHYFLIVTLKAGLIETIDLKLPLKPKGK